MVAGCEDRGELVDAVWDDDGLFAKDVFDWQSGGPERVKRWC